jgi:SAM-dependent methyltransferase
MPNYALPTKSDSAEVINSSIPVEFIPSVRVYDSKYFASQNPSGKFGGEANLIKFKDFIRPSDHVIDFGCGGGFLLKNLACRGKIGVEINPCAIHHARALGLQVVENAHEIPDDWADVIVSDNCLEHVYHPLMELRRLRPKLKKGGHIIFVVASETILMKDKSADVNHHLYSWSPLNLGNLFRTAGYRVISSKPFIHKWPPHFRTLRKWTRRLLFDALCRLYGYSRWEWFQVRLVATRD